MDGRIIVDGRFLKVGELVLNRVEVAEANTETGFVLMRSGHIFNLPPKVVQSWFADQYDVTRIKELMQ